MAQLDERTHGDLARLRARGAPSEAAKQRMYAALEAELGDPEGSDSDEGGPDDSGDFGDLGQAGSLGTGQLGYAAKIVGATLGMTGAGLLAVRVGVGIVRALASEPTANDSPDSAPTQPGVIATAPQEDDLEVVALDPPEESRAVEAAPKRSRPRPSLAAASEPEQTDTLAEELALLEAARVAEDPTAALVELERHLARFPHGSLAAERELLRVEVLCRLDRLDEARSLGERLLQEHPNAASRARLLAVCGGLGTHPSQK